MDTLNFGNSVFPVPTNTSNEMLQDLDPSLWALTAWIEGIANTCLTDKWNECVSKLPSTERESVTLHDGYRLIQTAVPFAVQESSSLLGVRFPFLCVFPESANLEQDSYSKKTVFVRTLKVIFCLPALTISQNGMFSHFKTLFAKCISGAISVCQLSTVNSGRNILYDAGLESVNVDRITFGNLEAEGSASLPCVEILLTIEEKFTASDSTEQQFGIIDANYYLSSIIEDSIKLINTVTEL